MPEQASLDEAAAFHLADACSRGRAAELAGVMGWDVQGYLAARGIAIIAAGDRSADQTDELAEELEQMGIL